MNNKDILVKARNRNNDTEWVKGFYTYTGTDHVITSEDGKHAYFVDPQTIECIKTKKIEKVKEKMCDEYCKYPEKVKDKDELYEDNTPCTTCPLNDI